MQELEIFDRCQQLAGATRKESFGLAIEWILDNVGPNSPNLLVETGRVRGNGEGQSTVILAILANHLNVRFVSIDFNPATTDIAKLLLDRHNVVDWQSNTTLLVDDSTHAISQLSAPVSFCYLDSAQSPDLELKEATALVEKMTKPAAILIDDCGPGGGKSVQSVPFLESRGWKCVACGVNQFQRFLTLD